MLPTFEYELKLWRKGFLLVCGADEVGRGAFAGPVVAGAVVWVRPAKSDVSNSIKPVMSVTKGSLGTSLSLREIERIGIDDSKKLRWRQRERCAKFIKENALSWGIGEVAVSVINRVGMGKATKMAFRRAVADCNSRLSDISNINEISNARRVEFLLIDAFYIPYTRGIKRKNQLAIVKGDEKSISIAAASIIAKVYRDRLMQKLSRKYRRYGWARNKGYGTRVHQEAIRKYGLTRLHRRDFVRKLVE